MSDPHDRSLGEVMDAVLAELQRDPLVWIEDGAFVVRDLETPNFRYELTCDDAEEALTWIEHLAEKNWITTDHLACFASLAIKTFGVRRK